ncbi:MAG: hypothetical protein B7733_15065 [Myxococcales bacterium FL481]|nr:MAG: hypothetical protein B7733_15065 [Myxococcales bacterium FL481]
MQIPPRASLILTVSLVTIGVLRFASDSLHDIEPDYWHNFHDSGLRYVIRAPSDGTWLGDLNAQWFKLLAMPAAISLAYLRSRFDSGTAAEQTDEFRDLAVRGVWLVVFLAGFTLVELEKQFGTAGFGARLVAGEDAYLNHAAHGIGTVVAWWLSARLTFPDDEPTLTASPPATPRRLGPRGRE